MRNKRKVAVKRVRKAERKLSREYQVLAELRGCKNCVELLDTFYTAGPDGKLTQNLVLELVPDSLENLIVRAHQSRNTIPVSRIRDIMRQVLEALAFIHRKNICHRDVKPDNILLDEQYRVKVCDFGSSKKLSTEGKNFPHVVSRYYRAPELLLCHTDYTTKIDIWAAGCILVELFTLDPLFPGKTEGLQLLETMAILGKPSESDKKYLYACLTDRTRSALDQLEGMQGVDLESVFPLKSAENPTKGYTKTEIRLATGLARKMLQWNPGKRVSAEQALEHPFFRRGGRADN